MTIEVLARGPSIKTYKPNGNFTVGVNAIFKYHPVDHLLMVDKTTDCEPEELQIILASTPKKFLSFHPWPMQNIELIKLASPRGCVKQLDSDMYCYSLTSAFVACVHAYKLGAKTIITHGIDFVGHPHLSRPHCVQRLLTDFCKLKTEFDKRGVRFLVSSTESELAKILPLA